MIIKKSDLPSESILKSKKTDYDYMDSYQTDLIDTKKNIGPTEIGKAFFSSGPKWIESLFALRNKIVVLFGLKTPSKISDRQKQLENFKCEPGERLGLFKVFDKTENEVVLGEDDKHLNFRVSLFLNNLSDNEKKLTITTTVKFHNSFGRLYFIPVKPFHKLIVPAMLKAIIKNLEQEKK